MELAYDKSLFRGPGRRAEDRKSGTNSFYSAFASEISRRRSAGIPKQPNISFSASKRSGRKAEAYAGPELVFPLAGEQSK